MPSTEKPLPVTALRQRVHPSVFILLVAGSLASVWIFETISAQERARTESEFQRQALVQNLDVHQTLEKYEILLATVQKHHDPAPGLMTNQVEASASLLREQGMPLLALQWAPRVRAADRAGFEEELRRAGVPAPAVIGEFTGGRRWVPSPPREEYFPRRFSLPMLPSQSLGVNLASEGVHREKMFLARDTGRLTLDSRQGTNQLPTFVFILPVFQPGADVGSVEARRAGLTGFLLAYMHSPDLVVALSRFHRDSGLEVLFSAPVGSGSNSVAYFIPVAERAQAATPELAAEMRSGLHREMTVKMNGFPVTFLYRPTADWLAAHRTLNRYGAMGSTLLLTILAAGFVDSLQRRRAVVEAQVGRRTEELQRTAQRLRESESLYQSLVSHLPQYVFRKDLAGRFTFVNRPVAEAFGQPSEAVLGKTDADFFPPDLAAKFREDDERVLATGEPLETEERTALGAAGTVVRVSKTALRDAAGNITGLQGIAWDITERHQFMEALSESESRFRAFMDNSPTPAWLKDERFRISYVNPAFGKLFRRGPGFLGRQDSEFMPGPASETARANDLAVLASGLPQQFVEQVSGANGRPCHLLTVRFPFNGPGGKRWVGGIAVDVSERVEAIEAVRQRERQMRLFVEHTPGAVAMFDREMRYLTVSRRWLEDYQLKESNIIGRSHYEVFPDTSERWKEIHRLCLAGAVERCDEEEFKRADGQSDWVRWEIHPWHDADGNTGGIIVFTEFITERKLAQQAVARRDAVLRTVASTADELVRVQMDDEVLRRVLAALGEATDVGRIFVFENHAVPGGDLCAGRRSEWVAAGVPSAAVGSAWQDFSYREAGLERWAVTLAKGEVIAGHAHGFPPAERAFLERQAVRSVLAVPIFSAQRWWGVLGLGECRLDREWSVPEVAALRVAAGVLGAAFDRERAERERLGIERKMVESQKLESLGVLAGGIAHDFNNLLTTILGNASLLRFDLEDDSPFQGPLAQIETTSLRAADLCKQMLAYSGRGRFQLKRLDLARLVEDTADLLRVSISKKVVLEFNFGSDVPAVEGDPTQLRQIVMNLVINASEAIGERGGTITLSTGMVSADRSYLATACLSPELPAGDYVFIEVGDDGCGMAPEVLARIFDPFFTTKFTGRGLGLAAVLGIVRGHRGGMKVCSEPGRGTSFRLLLPVAAGAVTATEAGSAASPEKWRGQGHVLVVDDEEAVRLISTRLLESLGFKVTVAADGRAGVEAFQREPGSFVLVLMDLTMPHLDGVQAFGQMRGIRPDVKIVLMSGFNEHDAVSGPATRGLAGFLQKPFDYAALVEKVRAVLEAKA
ncbi:MAG: PAS domain-containing protein [Limisphaerales bacterium]